VVAKVEKVVTENKLSFEEKKQLEKDLKKTQNKINKLENQVEELEAKIEELSNNLHDPTKYSDALLEQYNAAKQELEQVMTDWEENQLQEEELKNKLN